MKFTKTSPLTTALKTTLYTGVAVGSVAHSADLPTDNRTLGAAFAGLQNLAAGGRFTFIN